MPNREFARVMTEHFVRRAWPFYAISILAGLTLLLLVRDAFGVVVGLILVAYPVVAPIRYAGMAAARGRAFTQANVTFEITDKEIIVRSDEGGVTRGQLANIKRLDRVRQSLMVQFGKATYLVIPLEAFDPDLRASVEPAIRAGMMGLSQL